MKKFLVLFFSIFICSIAHADTETINWYVDGNSYETTTCQTGGDIILPTTPTKYGYTFQGWANYIPIEYLESTGTQWIDTDFIPRINTKIKVKAQKTEMYVYSGNIAGSKIASTNINNIVVSFYTNEQRIVFSDFGDYRTHRVTYQYTGDPVFVLEASRNSRIIYAENGTTVLAEENSIVSGDFSLQKSIWLFDVNGNESGEPKRLRGRIYYAKIYENNVLVRDFIPVLDNNGTPCMYDKVSGQFFYNQGTGNFIAGPVINQ